GACSQAITTLARHSARVVMNPPILVSFLHFDSVESTHATGTRCAKPAHRGHHLKRTGSADADRGGLALKLETWMVFVGFIGITVLAFWSFNVTRPRSGTSG
ncbi:MAG TPA: hypothetical protein VLT83_12220, partial [Opitutaceae bacterium]|nr:hypothetical protein [Opitutaceae bacterium]